MKQLEQVSSKSSQVTYINDLHGKFNMKKIIASAILSSALISVSAMATDTGGYVGVGIGDNMFNSNDAQITVGNPGGFSKNNNDVAYKIYAGYQFHPNFAVEAEYIDLGKQTVQFIGIARTNEMTVKGLNFSLVGNYPVYDKVDVFGKVGASYLSNNSYEYGADFLAMEGTPSANNTDRKWAPSFGMGVKYTFSKTVAARIEYEWLHAPAGTNTVDIKNNAFTASVQYSF
jgi:opacity protein-like surface antigen